MVVADVLLLRWRVEWWGGDQMRFWRGEERMLRMKRWGEMEGRAKIKTFRKVGARVCSFCLCIFSSLISQFSSLISHFFTSLSTQNHPYPHSTPLTTQSLRVHIPETWVQTAKASAFEIIKTRLSGSVGRHGSAYSVLLSSRPN